jgi:hypothetical protein
VAFDKNHSVSQLLAIDANICYDRQKKEGEQMNRIIIACGTLRRELLAAMEAVNCTDPIIWLKAGAHNVPKVRLAEIKAAMEQCKGFDTVLLCMTLCGNCLVGLNSGDHKLVLPRFDDCLSLLRGSRKRPADTYYLNEAWLSGSENLLNEYDAATEKYGKNRADRIFNAMLKNYRTMVWLSHFPAPERLRTFCVHFSLELVEEKPELSLLDQLLLSDWDEHFLILPPDTEITLEMRKGGEFHA